MKERRDPSIYNIRRFEMVKYSFKDDEEYVAIKEDEYEDLTSTSEDACRELPEKKSTMLVEYLQSGNLEVYGVSVPAFPKRPRRKQDQYIIVSLYRRKVTLRIQRVTFLNLTGKVIGLMTTSVNLPLKQVKYATCTLLDSASTWWNYHVKMVGIDAAYEISWKELMKMMTEVYCLRNEIQRMEKKLWNLTVKSNDFVGYTQCFQELALLCSRMVLDEEKKIESLMDQKERVIAARQAENNRKWENNPRDNHVQQLPHKSQNVARTYTAGSREKREYVGNLPFCSKCKLHHTGPYTVKCDNWKKVSHITRDCRNLTTAANQRAPMANQKTTILAMNVVFSIWKAFGGNTRDLGSFGEETDKTTNLHQHLLRISTQKLETASQIIRDAVTTHLKTASQDL
ncbi:reverse transcriptase domain-containing protein [Tanacetum coccineum]